MRTKQPESNITVAVRVRPLIEREKRLQHVSNVRVEDNLIVNYFSLDLFRSQIS